jgi:signal transduction histidine kinase
MAENLPTDSPWHDRARRIAELADGGRWEIDQAVRALAFVPPAKEGIAPSLAALTSSFERDSGIPVVLDVEGTPVRLGPRVERAVYRVTHEALANAWRHSRCTAIRVDLVFEEREVVVRVVDDGIGLGHRTPDGLFGPGARGMHRTVDDAGGTLRVRTGSPRGAVVEARVPKEER